MREAGGAFGKKEKAAEDQYFRQQQQKQLENLKKSHGDEIEHHEEEIKRHQVRSNDNSCQVVQSLESVSVLQEAIARHKAKMQEMDKWWVGNSIHSVVEDYTESARGTRSINLILYELVKFKVDKNVSYWMDLWYLAIQGDYSGSSLPPVDI